MVVVYHYSVTVWGCFAAGRLVVIDGTTNSSLQQKTLNKSVQKLESTWVLQLFHGVVLTLEPYFVPMRGFSFTVIDITAATVYTRGVKCTARGQDVVSNTIISTPVDNFMCQLLLAR